MISLVSHVSIRHRLGIADVQCRWPVSSFRATFVMGYLTNTRGRWARHEMEMLTSERSKRETMAGTTAGNLRREIALQNAGIRADSLRTTFEVPAGRGGQMKDALASGLDIPGIPLASPLNVLVSFSCVCLLVARIPRSPSRPPSLAAQACCNLQPLQISINIREPTIRRRGPNKSYAYV